MIMGYKVGTERNSAKIGDISTLMLIYVVASWSIFPALARAYQVSL